MTDDARRPQPNEIDMALSALLGHGHFPQDIRARSVVNTPSREWPHTP